MQLLVLSVRTKFCYLLQTIPMKPTEDLFELIDSLSKDEKRGFRIHAGRYESTGKPKKYLLLFDAISAQDEYSEEEIREINFDDPSQMVRLDRIIAGRHYREFCFAALAK